MVLRRRSDSISGDIFGITGNVAITYGDDKIVAGGGNDKVFGDYDPSQTSGFGANAGGNDIITGVDPTAATPGFGEVDIFYGNGGSDQFVLGDKNNVFYLGNGTADYARIEDFSGFGGDGDQIQLNGSAADYTFALFGTDTKITYNSGSELVGIVVGVNITAPASIATDVLFV